MNLNAARQVLQPPAGGILGEWSQIQVLIGYIAITINVCVLIFTADFSIVASISPSKIWSFVVLV